MSVPTPFTYRIYAKVRRLDRSRYTGFSAVTTGNVADAMGRWGAMDPRIRPVDAGMSVVGSALTVRARPCDNLIVYKALALAEPGDVLVIANGGFTDSSTWGDLTSLIGKEQGLAGMVTDGMTRDFADMRRVGFPVFCRGANPNSPFKDGPGEINVRVSCGGVTVSPGDAVVGDEDGVVVVPRDDAAAVLERAMAIAAAEEAKVAAIRGGDWQPPGLDDKLRAQGCVIWDEYGDGAS